MNDFKIGIALSGGGTRGMVHVGALMALEEHDIYPEVISGTSAGAVIGALYAYGYSPEEISRMAHKQSLFRLFGIRFPQKGFVRHSFLRRQLVKYIPENSFESLKYPLFITVANLNSGMPEVKREGPLVDFVIASSSIPVLFEPIRIKDELYVDGGLMNNLPASVLKGVSDFIIGVSLVPQLPAQDSNLRTMVDIANRCFNLSVLNNIKPEIQHCDVLIEPPAIGAFSRFNVSQIDKMQQIGYEETIGMIDDIREKIEIARKKKDSNK